MCKTECEKRAGIAAFIVRLYSMVLKRKKNREFRKSGTLPLMFSDLGTKKNRVEVWFPILL
jgi:hypothetical protein